MQLALDWPVKGIESQYTRRLLLKLLFEKGEMRQINASALAFNEIHFCPIYGASEAFTHRDAVQLLLSNERSTARRRFSDEEDG